MSPLDPIFQVNELPSQLFPTTETSSTDPLPQALMSKATTIHLNIHRGDGLCCTAQALPPSVGCAHIIGAAHCHPQPRTPSCSPGLSAFIQLSHAPARNHLLFREEIAFHALRNLTAVFAGRFQIDLSILLRFCLVIALCRAEQREEQRLRMAAALTLLSHHYHHYA